MAYGDSLTAGYGLSQNEAFPARLEEKLKARGHDVKVINAGVSGETSAGALTRLEWTLQQNPDYVILASGANDMLRGIDPAVTYGNLSKILRHLKERNIPVLLAGMKALPNYGAQYGKAYDIMYEELAKNHAAVFYPFFLKGVALQPRLNQPDGAHPNAAGADLMADNILPYAEKLLKVK